jgi:hypothetical protein
VSVSGSRADRTTLIQGILVGVLFLYCLFYHGTVNFQEKDSPTYVRQRIYRFSLVSATLMFIMLLLAIALLISFKVIRPR